MIRTHAAPRILALALAFLLLIALVVIAELGQNVQNRIGEAIARSQQRQTLLATLLENLNAAQAGQRAYLLTGDASQLAAYRDACARIEPTLSELAALRGPDLALLDSPADRSAVASLQSVIPTELAALSGALALHAGGAAPRATALIRTDLGKPTMSRINAAVVALRGRERQLLVGELARARRLRLESRALMYGVALLTLALLLVAALTVARERRRRAAVTARLSRENEELERRVRRRTAELSALSSHLQHLSEKEKAQLARELHDELGGLLIAVKMDVSWLIKRWPGPTAPEIQARWARVLKVLDEGVDFKRRVVENLRPTLLDNMGLLPAVRWVVHETCSSAGLQYTEVYPEQEPPLADDAVIMLFRLVQESLTNVAKHAHATHVRVQISLTGQELDVLVVDDGMGIDAERREALGSHGLAIMRHRVRSCGGELTIDSPPEGGTRVCARVPLPGILRTPAAAAAVPAAAVPADLSQAEVKAAAQLPAVSEHVAGSLHY